MPALPIYRSIQKGWNLSTKFENRYSCNWSLDVIAVLINRIGYLFIDSESLSKLLQANMLLSCTWGSYFIIIKGCNHKSAGCRYVLSGSEQGNELRQQTDHVVVTFIVVLNYLVSLPVTLLCKIELLVHALFNSQNKGSEGLILFLVQPLFVIVIVTVIIYIKSTT